MNDNVSERLARLERENRRIKLVGVLMLALFLGVFLLGQTPQPTVQDTVTARGFRLVDSSGNTRAGLTVDENGTAGLWLYDKDGKRTASLLAQPDTTSALAFYGVSGRGVIADFGTRGGEDGGVSLSFYDIGGNGMADFGWNSEGAASLSLSDANFFGEHTGGSKIRMDATLSGPALEFRKSDEVVWSAP